MLKHLIILFTLLIISPSSQSAPGTEKPITIIEHKVSKITSRENAPEECSENVACTRFDVDK